MRSQPYVLVVQSQNFGNQKRADLYISQQLQQQTQPRKALKHVTGKQHMQKDTTAQTLV
jgi:hypothetical protein